jgi:hypothetical protein
MGIGSGGRRLVVATVAMSVLLPAVVGGWAVAMTVSVGWAGELVEPVMNANQGAPRWLVVCGLIAVFLAGGTWLAGAVVWMILLLVIAGLDVYDDELAQYWVVGIGVSQYVLGVVVLAAGLPRWPLWVAAIGWTALAAISTPVVCVREEIEFRRYVQARAAYQDSPTPASNVTSD